MLIQPYNKKRVTNFPAICILKADSLSGYVTVPDDEIKGGVNLWYGFHDSLTIATSCGNPFSFTEYIFNLRSLQGFSFSVVGVGVFFFYLKIPDIVRSFPGKMTDKGPIMCI